ncbi:11694_t:CDS:1, partial [Acaulospora morrowiae]
GAVKVCAQWLKECFRESRTPKNTNSNNKITSEEDEGLVFTSRRSTINGVTKSQQNSNINVSPQQNHENITKLHLHTSHSLPNVFTSNEMIEKSSISPQMHVSTSEIELSPGHEREHTLWEKQNILSENEIMKRRREGLVRNLAQHSTFEKTEK